MKCLKEDLTTFDYIKTNLLDTKKGKLSDHTLLTMLLAWSIEEDKIQDISKILMKYFIDWNGIANATYEKLSLIKEIPQTTVMHILLVKQICDRMLLGNLRNTPILNSYSALADYLKCSMGGLKTEEFRVLYLNQKNILIAEEIQGYGTVNQTPIYPREIIKTVFFYEATAIILAHNHPSGNTNPSKADISVTKQLIEYCNVFDIKVHDHVIIGSNEVFSFKSNGLM